VSRTLSAALAFCLLPIAAAAQTRGAGLDLSAADQASQGPMTVERVHNGFMAAPEFKFTEIEKRSSGLAGGYAGVVFDEHFFIGGGAYVLTTNTRGRDLAYGGLMLQWFGGGDTFGFAAKTLVGGGRTEWSGTAQFAGANGRVIREPFRTSQGLYVAEPELDARVAITRQLHLVVGAGYRFTGYDRRDAFVDVPGRTRLNGAVGSVALQIGGGS
jgi:hypothetical protein